MKYQNIVTKDKVQCKICPRNCILSEGQRGFCKVRGNVKNNIILTSYGYNTGLAIDPVEKKPLYQFYPGTAVHISFLNRTSPNEIVEIAKKYNCKSVAFTYNDPIIFFEYALDTAKLCRQNGIKTIAVTSGFINKEPAAEFFSGMDAANIDLKGFSEEFYRKNCLAKLQPVLETIKYACNETDCHVELTTMLTEGENDRDEMIKQQCKWIVENIGDCVPLHFSAFFPNYKFSDRRPTAFSTLLKARQIALNTGLKYVYTGNLSRVQTSSTYCKNCSQPVIIRDGYKILKYNLVNGNCVFCNTKCDGEF